MSLSNTAVPKYYGEFRDAVIRGEIPICREIEMEMHRIDDLIANPGVYYDDQAIDGFISFCENEKIYNKSSGKITYKQYHNYENVFCFPFKTAKYIMQSE